MSQKDEHLSSHNEKDDEQNAQIDALVREIDDCIGRLKE
jgi:hypothetical protein